MKFFAATLVACGMASGALAQDMPTDTTGRYQISGANCIDEKKCVAFGIDTATGEVFACQYVYTPGLYDFGGQCKVLPMRERVRGNASN